MPFRSSLVVIAALAGTVAAAAVAPCSLAQTVPDGFELEVVAAGFNRPVGATFAADGRMFVWEQRGVVWVVEDGVVLAEPFIDLRDEVNGPWDRGLLGLALDPDFLVNRHVYLLYTVDMIYGEPDESPWDGAFSRLTRYTGSADSGGNVADLDSRLVLIGATMPEGIPVCEPSHTIGSLVFGHDGSLFVTAGDGASFNIMDDGGNDPDCFGEGGFDPLEDIGAFRSQYLGSLAGKVLRIDPATGLGLPDNPHFDGDPAHNRSRVWVNGVRNPYRTTIRPNSPAPGTLYVGDVGWSWYEEINIARGGENFGWPCWSGGGPAQSYPTSGDPAHSGCDSIETPENPGPLTDAVAWWHHTDGSLSNPPGMRSRAIMAGAFHEGGCYPEPWRGGLFIADYVFGWMIVMQVDEHDELVSIEPFGTGFDRPTGLALDPVTGDLHILALNQGTVTALRYVDTPASDIDGDCVVGVSDLLIVLGDWGPCPGCAADLDGDGAVGVNDLLMVLADWS